MSENINLELLEIENSISEKREELNGLCASRFIDNNSTPSDIILEKSQELDVLINAHMAIQLKIGNNNYRIKNSENTSLS